MMNKITEEAIVKGCLLEVIMHDNDNTTLEIWVNNGYYHFRNNSKISNCSTCYKSFKECKNSFEYSYNYILNHADIYGACKPEITYDRRTSSQKDFELDKIHPQQQLEEVQTLEEVHPTYETMENIIDDNINNLSDSQIETLENIVFKVITICKARKNFKEYAKKVKTTKNDFCKSVLNTIDKTFVNTPDYCYGVAKQYGKISVKQAECINRYFSDDSHELFYNGYVYTLNIYDHKRYISRIKVFDDNNIINMMNHYIRAFNNAL